MITASVYCIPGSCNCLCTTIDYCSIAERIDCRCSTGIRCRWCGKRWRRCTLNSCICSFPTNCRRSGICNRDRLRNCSTMISASVYCIPGSCNGLCTTIDYSSVTERIDCRGSTGIRCCWCGKRWRRCTLYSCIYSLSTNCRRSGICNSDRLRNCRTMITASIYCIPGSCNCLCTTIDYSSITEWSDCRRSASIRCRWRSEGWCGSTLDRCVTALSADCWRSGIYNSYRLRNR